MSGDSSANLNSPLGSDELDIDLSNMSPLSSVQAHNAGAISHPYFSTLDNRQRADKPPGSSNAETETTDNETNANSDGTESEKMTRPLAPINITPNNTKRQIHYSHTPNILYGFHSVHTHTLSLSLFLFLSVHSLAANL